MEVGVTTENGLGALLIATVEHKPEQEHVATLLLLMVARNVKEMKLKVGAATTTHVQVGQLDLYTSTIM